MYMYESLGVRKIEDSGSASAGRPEYIFVEICDLRYRKWLLASVYRPPHVGYLYEFEKACTRLFYSDLVVIWNFNIDLYRVTHDSTSLHNFIATSDFYLVPFLQTHHVRDSLTLIDLCFVADGERVLGY